MKTLSRVLASAALAAGLALSATVAEAAPGIVRVSNASVRVSPSSTAKVVKTLHRKDYVIVRSCGANWCKVHNANLDGYVLRTQLYNPYYGSYYRYEFAPPTPDPGRMHTPGR